MVKTLEKHIGERFGYLVVTDINRRKVGKHYYSYFVVRCDCGSTKEMMTVSLKRYGRKGARSCGCKSKELRAESRGVDGRSKTNLYRTYQNMKARCSNKNLPNYHRYGGRGIKVCDEWMNNFDTFKEWAHSNGYNEDLSIERINNDGNYEPNNCKWIPMPDQQKNKTHDYEHNVPSGEKSPHSKLKEQDVREIKYLINKGFTHKEISLMYKIGKSTVSRIKNKITWGHVE